MSLLLTCHIDQYDIDVRRLRRGCGPDRLCSARLQPLADQLAMQPVVLDHQYALHAGLPQ